MMPNSHTVLELCTYIPYIPSRLCGIVSNATDENFYPDKLLIYTAICYHRLMIILKSFSLDSNELNRFMVFSLISLCIHNSDNSL